MDDIVFVEILDRHGAVRQRVRLESLPATIGRGYRNAVILDDPYASPIHARLDRDPERGLVLEDANSDNGLFSEPGGMKMDSLPVEPGTEVRMGRTRVRFMTPEAEVPPARSYTAGEGRLLDRLGSPAVSVGLLAATIALFLLYEYLRSYEPWAAGDAVGVMIALAAVIAIWAGFWALIARIVIHRFEFLTHLAVASAFLLMITVYMDVTTYLEFLFVSELLPFVLMLPTVALGVTWLYGHLAFASTLSHRARLAWSLGVVFTFFALGSIVAYSESQEFSTFTEDPGMLRPVHARWIPTMTLADYMVDVDELQAEVNEMAEED